MDEQRIREIKWLVAGLILILLIAGSVSVILNTRNSPEKSSVPLTDPETGLQNWIEAVNGRNIDRVYNLFPDEIQQQRTLNQFKEDNINNTLLRQGSYFINYTVMDKKQNGTYAQLIAQVYLHQSVNQTTLGPDVPIYYKFGLYYQHGEWKIWTLPWA